MKKALLALFIAVFCFSKSSNAQIMVTFENNTSQYFTSTLLDVSWSGVPPTHFFIDVVNNLTQQRYAYVQTGTYLASAADWRGVAFRTYPGGITSTVVSFPSVPYAGTFTAAGVTYNIKCTRTSPTQLYIRIDP